MRPRRHIELRMLTKEQAAEYCGVTSPTFLVRCPIPPVSLGPDARLNRWDVRALDAWLDTFSGAGAPSGRLDMAELMRIRTRAKNDEAASNDKPRRPCRRPVLD